MGTKILVNYSPSRTILFSMFFTALVGSILLALPIARTTPLSFLDIFFTATSTTCVTGLFTVPIDSFSLFGKGILLILMQIGGIGLVTMSLFALSLFMKFGLARQIMAEKILDIEFKRNIPDILLFIIQYTLTIELIGAIVFFIINYDHATPIGKAIFYAIFYSVSAFCNAGIIPTHHTLDQQINHIPFLCTLTFLAFIGGLGFITWNDLIKNITLLYEKKRIQLSLQSKLVLYGSTILITLSTIIIWFLEHNHSLLGFSLSHQWFLSLFNAVSFRSAGFIIQKTTLLHPATLWLILLIAFIGSAPGSTGSGVKITTIIILIMLIRAVFLRKNAVEIRGRNIPIDQVYKAIAIIGISMMWIFTTTFFLLITESHLPTTDLLFEAVSAISCLGISTGITPHLSTIGKLFIIISMFIGRVGSVSFILALQLRTPETTSFSYPEERIMLG